MKFSGPAPINVRIKRNPETGNATEDLLQLQQDLELSDEEGLGTVLHSFLTRISFIYYLVSK